MTWIVWYSQGVCPRSSRHGQQQSLEPPSRRTTEIPARVIQFVIVSTCVSECLMSNVVAAAPAAAATALPNQVGRWVTEASAAISTVCAVSHLKSHSNLPTTVLDLLAMSGKCQTTLRIFNRIEIWDLWHNQLWFLLEFPLICVCYYTILFLV